MKLSIACAPLLVVLLSGMLWAEDGELKKIEGRFERHFQNGSKVTFRAVKEVSGENSSVTTYDDAGNIVESHRSTISVEKKGPVRVLSFSNVTVTAGAHKGQTDAGPYSYIYRMEGETFTEVWGLLEGDESPPRILVWRRVNDTK